MGKRGRKPKGEDGAVAAAATVDRGVVWKGPDWLRAHLVPLDAVHEDPGNVNTHDERSIAAIAAAYARYGQQKNVVADASGVVRAGNGQLAAAARLGWTHIAVGTSDLTGADLVGFAIADNETARFASFDEQRLVEQLRALQSEDYPVEDTGFDPERIDRIIDDLAAARLRDSPPDGSGAPGSDPAPPPEEVRKSLADRFGVPPFSVLDARQGYWQDRKRLWLSLGIQSELGRGGGPIENGTAGSPGRPMPAMQMTDGKTVRGDAKGGGGGRPGEYNGRARKGAEPSRAEPSRARKGTYNDRKWIKDKGLTGLAQDAHVTPALAGARGRRATTGTGNAGEGTGSP
jgi:hypothetical protein